MSKPQNMLPCIIIIIPIIGQLLPITIIPTNTIIGLFPNPTINVKPSPLPQVRPDRGLGRGGLVTEECPWG